jgi:plastocyanin
MVVTIIVTAAACNSDSPTTPDDPGGEDGSAVTITANPNNTFSPANVTISAGDTVTFRNNGGNHNVAADDGSFRCANGCDGQGGNGSPSTASWSFTFTFNEAGVVNYHCESHQAVGMTGTITVQ